MRRIAAVSLLALLLGCGPEPEETGGRLPMAGGGGFSASFKDLFSDMRKVDLGDLIQVGARFATEEVNRLLDEVPYVDIQLAPTEVYVTSEEAKQDLTLHDLEALTAGLLARFGDKDFISHVNRLRVKHLRENAGQVFAEAQFRIDGRLSPSFSFDAAGLPAQVGFLAAEGVQATVVAPCRNEHSALLAAPLKAIKAVRGFVLPSRVQDVLAMTPGESLSLRSQGAVGLNVGVGIPIYITTIESVATLHAVISAAARATLQGDLDIQLVRDEGAAAVVDVGITGDVKRFLQLAVDTRWGIDGLPELKLQVGPLDVDLGRLAERALEDLLNRKLSLAGVTYIKEQDKLRHTVARFSFDLARGEPAIEQAMVQALRGDIRLAQALGNRPGSGVVQLLDLTRDSRSLSTYLGAHFLSLRFFRQTKQSSGSIVITSGPESQQLLFDELDKESGLFFTTRAYKRRGLVSLKSNAGRLVDADFNLGLQLRENDSYTERDQVLDHVDPLLAVLIGKDRLTQQLAPLTDGLEHYLDERCPRPIGQQTDNGFADAQWRACLQNAAGDPAVGAGQAKAQAAFDALKGTIQGGLDPSFDNGLEMAAALFKLKLAVQSSSEFPATWTGPKSAMTIDLRLTSAALDSLLGAPDGAARFRRALEGTLLLMQVKRNADPLKKNGSLAKTMAGLQGELDRARDLFAAHAAAYARVSPLAGLSYLSKVMGQTTLGDQAHLVVVTGEGDTLASIAERKTSQTIGLFDVLVKELDLDVPSDAQAIVYALLAAIDPSQTELLVNLDFKKDDYSDFPDTRLYGRGKAARLIDAGQFSIDSLIGN